MSRERIFHLADQIIERMKDQGIEVKDYRRLRSTIISAFTEEMRFFESLDAEARERISRMRKQPPEGSPEWQALYEKFFDEAFSKRVRA